MGRVVKMSPVPAIVIPCINREWEIFRRNMRFLRERDEMTQAELGRVLRGMTGSAVSSYERGIQYPNMKVAFKIAEVFGVTLVEMLATEMWKPVKEEPLHRKLMFWK